MQDLYLDYAHELNEKASLVVTDRYRYSDQAVNDSGSNNQFAENVFKASVRYIIDQRNSVNALISFKDRAYDNDSLLQREIMNRLRSRPYIQEV